MTGETADLFGLVAAGEREELARALEEGGKADARDENGNSLLYLAAERGDLEMLELLLARGADPNAANLAGNSPLMAAAARGHLEVASRLLAAGAAADHRNRWGFDARRWAEWSAKADEIRALLAAHGKT